MTVILVKSSFRIKHLTALLVSLTDVHTPTIIVIIMLTDAKELVWEVKEKTTQKWYENITVLLRRFSKTVVL